MGMASSCQRAVSKKVANFVPSRVGLLLHSSCDFFVVVFPSFLAVEYQARIIWLLRVEWKQARIVRFWWKRSGIVWINRYWQSRLS